MTKRLRTCLIALSVAVLLVAVSVAQPPKLDIPSTPATVKLQELFTALNSGSEEKWLEWVMSDPRSRDSAAVKERRVNFLGRMYDESGGFDLWQVNQAEQYTAAFLVKARAPKGPDEWLVFGIVLEETPPHGVAMIKVEPGDEPTGDLPEGPLTDAQITSLLDEYISKLVSEDKFSGTVVLAKNGKPIYTRAAGEAYKPFEVPNRLDTKFNLGSMNKMFTGVAIAQLAQEGKLSFTDPIIKYLPDYPNKEVAEKVTIHHLLTHTSGMNSYWQELFDTAFWEIRTVQQLADLIINKPLDFEPGARFQYSNSGPVILGLIIEKVSGMDYFDYIRERIYKPAGMINSDSYAVDQPEKNLAVGYTQVDYAGRFVEGGWRSNYYMHAVRGGPAGGGYSTVEDLLAFANGITGHKLLNQYYTDTVTTGKVPMEPGMMYAYLFGDRTTTEGHRVVGHSGGAPGINASLRIYTDLGYTVAVMSNYDMAAEKVANKVEGLLFH